MARPTETPISLPKWAVPLILAILGWGIAQEVRVARVETHYASVKEGKADAALDHDRLTRIETRVDELRAAMRESNALRRQEIAMLQALVDARRLDVEPR